jgi:hypothetical protein
MDKTVKITLQSTSTVQSRKEKKHEKVTTSKKQKVTHLFARPVGAKDPLLIPYPGNPFEISFHKSGCEASRQHLVVVSAPNC